MADTGMRRLPKKMLLVVGVVAVLVGGAGRYLYSSFYTPAQILNSYGVYEIRPWTTRQHSWETWIDGSAATYAYEISAATEERLRKRCLRNIDPTAKVPNATCYIAVSPVGEVPAKSVAVGTRVVFLYYIWG